MAEQIRSEAHPLFSTPIVLGMIPEAQSLNERLKTVILERKANHEGIHRSNILGWHSSVDMLAWAGDGAHELGRQACALIDPYSADIVSPDELRFGWVAEMWANVSPPNASNQMHAHPGAFWSLVYYVDDGYDGPDQAQRGELVLHDPRFPMNKMYAPDMVFRWPNGKLDKTLHAVRPRTGMMVAFPSWLKHSVRPYFGKRDRISIAINLMVTPVDASNKPVA